MGIALLELNDGQAKNLVELPQLKLKFMTQIDELYQKLLDLDEDSLKAQLGISAQECGQDTTGRSASLESLDKALSATPRRGSPDSADVNFGDRLFKRLNVKSYNLMCSELFDDREIQAQLQTAFKDSLGKAAGLLTRQCFLLVNDVCSRSKASIRRSRHSRYCHTSGRSRLFDCCSSAARQTAY